MSCLGERIKPVSGWVIVNYRWKVPYVLDHTVRPTRKAAIKCVTDATGWTWKTHYRMGMRAVKVMVMSA